MSKSGLIKQAGHCSKIHKLIVISNIRAQTRKLAYILHKHAVMYVVRQTDINSVWLVFRIDVRITVRACSVGLSTTQAFTVRKKNEQAE